MYNVKYPIFNVSYIYIIATAPLFLSLSEKVELCRRPPPPPKINTSGPDFPSLLCIQSLRQTGCLKLSSLLTPVQPAPGVGGAAVVGYEQGEEGSEKGGDRGRVVMMCAQAEDPVTASQCFKRAVCSPGHHTYQNIG